MRKLSRSKSGFLGIGFAIFTLITACSCSTHAPQVAKSYDEELKARKPDLSRVGDGQGVRLSEALQKNLKTETITSERAALVRFIATGKKNNYELCRSRFHQAPECAFLKEGWVDSWLEDNTQEGESTEAESALKSSQRTLPVKMTRELKRKHQRLLSELTRNLRNGKFEKLPGQLEGDYFRALKKFSSWSELSTLTTNVLAQKECTDPEIYTYLGLKGEEYFPDEAILKTSMELYAKADQCVLANRASTKYLQIARFRLGLLSILKNDCKQAQSVFTRLSKMGTTDYSSRALYWNAYCAKSESKRDEFFASFDGLFKMNPLGFHTLSMTNGDSLLVENLSKPIDPIVKTRTMKEGQLNIWIGLIEDLDKIGDTNAVNHLLAPVRKSPEYLGNLEPGVRLYLASFAYRARDMISLFRVLDSVFRTQSEYVVDSTLKLFYPLKHLDSIMMNAKKVDPLLVAALIRQESAFQETVKSRVGAMGLMQLMPATARLLDRKIRKQHLLKADTNIRLGVRYFEMLVDRYGGDVELALAAYNAGAEVVDRWKQRYPVKNRLLFLDLIPFAETRNYVTLIGRNYYWYSQIYSEQLKQAQGIAQSTSSKNEFRGMKSE